MLISLLTFWDFNSHQIIHMWMNDVNMEHVNI